MWKSVRAIVAGILTLTITSFAIELAVNPIFIYTFGLPDWAALNRHAGVKAFTLAYSLVCVAIGGYVCARLAPRLPLRHAIVMGVAQVGMTFLAMLSLPEIASRVQWIVSAILAFPAAVAGGVWYTRRTKATA